MDGRIDTFVTNLITPLKRVLNIIGTNVQCVIMGLEILPILLNIYLIL